MSILRPFVPPLLAFALIGSFSGCQVHVAIGTPSEQVDQLFAAGKGEQPTDAEAGNARLRPSQRVAGINTWKPSANGKSGGYAPKTSLRPQPPLLDKAAKVIQTAGKSSVRVRVTDDENTSNKDPRGPSLLDNGASLHEGTHDDWHDTVQPEVAAASGSSFPTVTDASLEPNASTAAAHPIDLPTVLRLSGGENWDIQIATERVNEARAKLDAAKLLWLPSLNAGIGYNKHDGQIQDTSGQVIDVSRNSLFVGGAAVVSDAPATGGSGGPGRMFVDFSVADAIFAPLAAKQVVQAEQARESAAFNDTLRDAATAYYQLVAAQGQLSVAQQNLADTEKLQQLTNSFVVAGKGAEADNARIRVESSRREQAIIRAEVAAKIAGVELARILRLSTATELIALEEKPVPVEFVSEAESLPALIAHAHMYRPEMAEFLSEVQADHERMRAERWRPFLPNINVSASSGGFGGGLNGNLRQLDGRADFDVIAVWQLRNLGFGARAAQREQGSRLRQSMLANSRIQDVVAADVAKAYHEMHAQRKQLELTEKNIELSQESYRKNIARIRGLEGLPLEALQALQMLATSRDDYIGTVYAYNRAQVRLQHAIGRQPVDQAPTPQPIAEPPVLIEPEINLPLVPAPATRPRG